MKYEKAELHGYPTIIFHTNSLKNKTFVELDKVAFMYGADYIYVLDKSGKVLYNRTVVVLSMATDVKSSKCYTVPITAFKEAPKGSVSY